MIIGTAGHIDHGKTALVRALTGVDTDRLPEEKARGITLDLGYAYQPLESGDVLGFVDVPGHERLVHTMVAGATGIDFVLLVVAADDGPMPQTCEHVQVLDLLGLARGAVALTKGDRVSTERASEAAVEIRHLLAATPLADSPIFPVCALTGAGIGDLRQYLQEAARQTPPRAGGERFRLAVDRSFTLTGIGTVVTGTVYSGCVRVGDRLLISPSGREARVRGIHAQNQPAECGAAGQRCALNLAGPDLHRQDIHRGDWALDAALHAPTTRLDVELRVPTASACAASSRPRWCGPPSQPCSTGWLWTGGLRGPVPGCICRNIGCNSRLPTNSCGGMASNRCCRPRPSARFARRAIESSLPGSEYDPFGITCRNRPLFHTPDDADAWRWLRLQNRPQGIARGAGRRLGRFSPSRPAGGQRHRRRCRRVPPQ